MDPLRVLVVSNMYPSPDHPQFGVFVRDRVDAFRRAGAAVDVVAITDTRSGPVRTPAKYAHLFLRALAAVARRRPDVIEGHYVAPTALVVAVVAAVVRRPFALYIHGSDVALDHPPMLDRPLRWAVAKASTLHTNSQWTAQVVTDRFGRAPQVIPPGVDLDVFHPPRTPAERSGVAFAGGLHRHKGVDVLLRALSRLPAHTLTIAGDGPERPDLVAFADDLGVTQRTRWLGEVDHHAVADMFRHAAVAAVPSRRDALGLVALEALACGTPVVVSAVGGLAGIPTDECGSTVPPDDPDVLAREIEYWSTRAGPSTVEAAVAKASIFSLDAVAEAALDDLRRVAGTTAR